MPEGLSKIEVASEICTFFFFVCNCEGASLLQRKKLSLIYTWCLKFDHSCHNYIADHMCLDVHVCMFVITIAVNQLKCNWCLNYLSFQVMAILQYMLFASYLMWNGHHSLRCCWDIFAYASQMLFVYVNMYTRDFSYMLFMCCVMLVLCVSELCIWPRRQLYCALFTWCLNAWCHCYYF